MPFGTGSVNLASRRFSLFCFGWPFSSFRAGRGGRFGFPSSWWQPLCCRSSRSSFGSIRNCEKYAADVITLGNFSCGALAILFAWAGEFKSSVGLILIAGVLDMADGLIARKTKPPKQKVGLTFGDNADDVGDGVSFALAPAAILYFLGKTTSAVIYLVATLWRLWFFTDQEKKGKSTPGVFRGVPSPAAAIFLGSFLLWEHPISSADNCDHRSGAGRARSGLFFPWYQFRWYHFRMIPRVPLPEKAAAGILGTFAFFFVGSGEALSVLSILYSNFFLLPRCQQALGLEQELSHYESRQRECRGGIFVILYELRIHTNIRIVLTFFGYTKKQPPTRGLFFGLI